MAESKYYRFTFQNCMSQFIYSVHTVKQKNERNDWITNIQHVQTLQACINTRYTRMYTTNV